MGTLLRPILAIPGVLAVMGVLLLAYFATGHVLSSGTLGDIPNGSVGGTPTEIVLPSNSYSLTGNSPVTVSYSDLPLGSSVHFVICPTTSLSSCQGVPTTVTSTARSGSLSFTLGQGQMLVVYANSPGVNYQATAPDSGLYSFFLVAALVVGVVLMVAGLASSPSEPKGADEPPATPRSRKTQRPVEEPPPSREEGLWAD
jgi:hypothetical protein